MANISMIGKRNLPKIGFSLLREPRQGGPPGGGKSAARRSGLAIRSRELHQSKTMHELVPFDLR
jgi:hypothetical protein